MYIIVNYINDSSTLCVILFYLQPFHEENGLKCRFGASGSYILTNASLQPQPNKSASYMITCSSIKVGVSVMLHHPLL